MNKTLRGFLILGGAGATAFGGYVALQRLRGRPEVEPETPTKLVPTEIVRQVEVGPPAVEIVREPPSASGIPTGT